MIPLSKFFSLLFLFTLLSSLAGYPFFSQLVSCNSMSRCFLWLTQFASCILILRFLSLRWSMVDGRWSMANGQCGQQGYSAITHKSLLDFLTPLKYECNSFMDKSHGLTIHFHRKTYYLFVRLRRFSIGQHFPGNSSIFLGIFSVWKIHW